MARRLCFAAPLLLLLSACADAPRAPEIVVVPPAAAPPERETALADTGAALARPAPRALVAADATPSLLVALRQPASWPPRRGKAALISDLQALESANVAAPRPELLRKLGDRYAVLALVAADDGKDKVVHAARISAIKNYQLLLGSHPGFCVAPSAQGPGPGAGCEDETLYSLGYELELEDRREDAGRTYFQLIQGWASSPYIPLAYLGFGEMFFREAAGDPSKWPLAEQSFKEVLKYPFPANGVYGYALLRLAQTYEEQGDRVGARASYQRLGAAARAQPGMRSLELPASLIPAGMGP